ncbi:MAG: recombinase family protein, partial [Vulcanisaeta sp.]|nr:recombinase family protein [Vulcanisaeta sp.]
EKGYNILFVKHPELNVVQNSPLGEAIRKATLAMLSISAEIERALISERTKSALARAKAMGKHIGRKGTQIPVDVVRQYLSMGLTKKAVYRLLVQQGLLRYTERGTVRVLSYNQFLQRLKALGL